MNIFIGFSADDILCFIKSFILFFLCTSDSDNLLEIEASDDDWFSTLDSISFLSLKSKFSRD